MMECRYCSGRHGQFESDTSVTLMCSKAASINPFLQVMSYVDIFFSIPKRQPVFKDIRVFNQFKFTSGNLHHCGMYTPMVPVKTESSKNSSRNTAGVTGIYIPTWQLYT